MLVYQRVYDEDEVEDKGTHKCMATSKLNFGSSHWHGPRVPRIWTGLHFCSHETVIGCAHFPKPLERSSGRIEIHVRQLLAQMPQHNETHVCIYIYRHIHNYIYIYTHKYVYTVYTHTILWSTLGYAGSCHPNLLKSLWHLHHVAPQFASFPVKSHPPCSIGCKQFVTNFTCLLAECYSIRE